MPVIDEVLQVMEKTADQRLGWAPWDNCTSPAILDFPYSGFLAGVGGLAAAAVVLVYMYSALTVVYNLYLLPALEELYSDMGLASDVAGATMMAAFASAPEFFISTIGTFFLEGNLQVGAIVGSSTFNCLFVPGICALFGSSLQAKRIAVWPMTRDTLMFCISLTSLILCFEGDIVYWYEALLMVVLYGGYVIALLTEKHVYRKTVSYYQWIKEAHFENSPISRLAGHKCYNSTKDTACFDSCEEAGHVGRAEQTSFLEKKKGPWYERGCQRMSWPVAVVLDLTIPVKYPRLALGVSLLWIVAVTYIITWMIIVIGYRLNVPDSLMGLTVLGVGLGMPELLSSLKAAKSGKGTMALCNAMGANTFNILVCLGLPMSLKLIFTQKHTIWIEADGLVYNCLLILIIVTILYGTVALNSFVLDRKIGIVFLVFYSIYVVTTTLIEMNVFSRVNLPMCNIKDYFND